MIWTGAKGPNRNLTRGGGPASSDQKMSSARTRKCLPSLLLGVPHEFILPSVPLNCPDMCPCWQLFTCLHKILFFAL